jgi:indole-3-glycerol phosphate synthase
MGKDFLNTIVQAKKEEISTARRKVSETLLRENANRAVTRRPFFKSLATPGPRGINIIAEVKRASPSKGAIRLDLNPATCTLAYEKGGACAISVLTDEAFFKGSLEDLKTARENTSLPVLRKEFIISSYQIYESAAAQADAVLLIVRILEKQQLKDYLDLCTELGMDALVEIHSEEEIENTTFAGAKLIGINNRDLSSFDTHIGRATAIASLLEPGQVPVAASGMKTREDIQHTKEAGIFNFLIGESLVRADDTQGFLASLF